jgi:membrane fusion protein, multidrug efflux system
MKKAIIITFILLIIGVLGYIVVTMTPLASVASFGGNEESVGQFEQEYNQKNNQVSPKKNRRKMKKPKVQEITPKLNKKDLAIPVKVLPITPESFTTQIKTVGVVNAKFDYTLSAKLNGEIKYLKGEVGSSVVKGEVLAKIDPEMVQASLLQAQANYDLARKTYKRQKNLSAKNLISAQQLDSSETQYTIARSNLKMAKINVQNSIIASPITGVIAEKFSSLYEFSAIGKPMIRVVDIRTIEVDVWVSAKDSVKIKKGQKAYLRVAAYSKELFLGYVTKIGLQADSDSKTFPVTIELDNKEQLIRGGMIADITVILETYTDAIVVPLSALQKSESGNSVFVAFDGTAELRQVEIGGIEKSSVQILSGLHFGEQLIVEGENSVNNGSKIQVVGSY